MAVTHADIEIQRKRRKLGRKAGTAVIVLCIFCGILGFVFSVFAECTKTKVPLFSGVSNLLQTFIFFYRWKFWLSLLLTISSNSIRRIVSVKLNETMTFWNEGCLMSWLLLWSKHSCIMRIGCGPLTDVGVPDGGLGFYVKSCTTQESHELARGDSPCRLLLGGSISAVFQIY